ncbi:aminotransferase class V-fold PLP-dependent enzyme [Methylobacterium sp. C25]|uniref:aminotransferase class V-fold PLP-dependent enzyme n=1 Tax=Methylobacterium sp. C25 TaxID=2721622 RepID=UPI002D7EF300|nr:aminotransferase class V-fold PLP-dependent enzyme [Methylobacterium sp. C25]
MTGALPCSAIGRSPAQSAADWLTGWGDANPPTWQGGPSWGDGRTVFTTSGRSAIALAAQIWKIGNGDEILVPAYNCGSEIGPLAATGATLILYRVDGAARIDLADLVGRITSRTRVVYIIHYFGRAAEIGQLRAICSKRGIKLFEDCALSLFSAATGLVGDASVFSLPKSLPAIDGGLLWMPGTEEMPPPLFRPHAAAIVKGFGRQAESWFFQSNSLRLPGRRIRRRTSVGAADGDALPDLPKSYEWPTGASLHRASRFAVGLLRRTDPTVVVTRRRAHYARLRHALADTPGITFLWDEEELPPGMCPLGLPILVSDKRAWCDRLQAAGIFVTPWWTGCFRGLDWQSFPDALALKSRLILLPVHQGLEEDDMAYVAGVVRDLARRESPEARRRSYLKLTNTLPCRSVP